MQELYNTEDGNYNVIFESISGEILRFPDLKNCLLSEEIYYRPSMFPYISRITSEGSLYKDYTIPSGQYSFIKNKKLILEQKLSLQKYIDDYYSLLSKTFENIIASNQKFVLSFSGGIDSLAVLSFFDKLNALDKVEIVNYENYFVDEHPDLLRNNQSKSNALSEIQKFLKKEFIKIKVTNDDWLYCANNGNYTDLKSYCLSTLLRKFPSHIIVSGLFGDKTLLHDTIWLDQLQTDNTKILENKKLYMNNFLDYDFKKNKTPLKDYTFHMRNFFDFKNKIFNPLSLGLRLCRQIDLQTLTLHDILDAVVAREIIYRNVKNNYTSFIIHQGNYDGDNFSKKMFKRNKFSESVLKIPCNINHNVNGYKWLSELLAQDSIETNSITSVKMLHYINEIQTKNF